MQQEVRSICGRIALIIVVFFLAVAMVALGIAEKDECPAEPMVPVFLIGDFSIY